MKIIDVIKLDAFLDGGTTSYKDKDDNCYFIDKRIKSTTKGKVYNGYPGDKGNFILDVELNIVKSF